MNDDPFYIDPKAQLAPGITYEDAINEAVAKLAEDIDRQVLEALIESNKNK